jgi:deoxyribodipyrimidine photolyase
MDTAIWWISPDLRLSGNLALDEVFHKAGSFIPLFILDP